MDRTRHQAARSSLLAALTAAALAAAGLVAAAPSARAADADLLRNGGFESGLDGWSCTSGSGAVVDLARARRHPRPEGHPGRQ